MNIWTVPTPFVFGLMALVLYFGLLSMKIQTIAYNLGTQFATKRGSGVSKPSLNSFCTLVTPTWVRVVGWVSTLMALLLLIYVGMRYGWFWAIGYAAADHLLKTFGFPILPSVRQGYSLIQNHASKSSPGMAAQILEYRDSYVHKEAAETK
jgi:hypothetical protein